MITVSNFGNLLSELGFTQTGNVYTKDFPAVDAYLRVDFGKQELIYPEVDILSSLKEGEDVKLKCMRSRGLK